MGTSFTSVAEKKSYQKKFVAEQFGMEHSTS